MLQILVPCQFCACVKEVKKASQTYGDQANTMGNYNPGQNCWHNSPHYNVDFSRSPKSKIRSSITRTFQRCLGGKGARKGPSERRTRVVHITMEACTVNSLLFAQNLTSVPKTFDPDCTSLETGERTTEKTVQDSIYSNLTTH